MIVNDIKVTIIGDGGVGKTSIVRALNNKNLIKSQITQGIDIQNITIHHNEDQIRIKVWDFGGQEIYHSIHQLFLTKRTIYIITLDSRQENNIIYWLKTVQKLVGNVPIIIAINKIDLFPSFDIEQNRLKLEFPEIVGFIRISCKTLEGINELKSLILDTAKKLEFSQFDIPKSWLKIHSQIEAINKDYISNQLFVEICNQNGVTDKEGQNTISNYFHDLGIFIHFKNFQLYNTQILNPIWITEAIYLIINSRKAHEKQGIITELEIFDLFLSYDNEKYPKDTIQFIISVMEEFELILKADKNRYIIPQLLSNESSSNISTKDATIKVLFQYDFFPKSLFNRIIVRTATQIGFESIWRNGMQLNHLQSNAEIKNDPYEKTIAISVSGKRKRDLLFIIREIIKNVNLSYDKIKVKEIIPIGTKESVSYISYEDLLVHKEFGEESILDVKTRKIFNIKKLLEGIEPKKEEKSKLNPVKIFISYSHNDSDYKIELLKHLSPLVRLEEIKIWEDGRLIPGQNWETEIMEKLNDADIVLCLMSSDFINSDFCYSIELANALEAHSRDEKILIPVIIRACYWKKLPIAKIQGIPEIAISSQQNSDEGWKEVVMGIDKSIENIRINKYDIHKV